jgi:hypothetical protein
MTKLEDWLRQMQAFSADHAGPAVKILARRNKRDLGWSWEINGETNIDDLVEHIDSACRDSGFAGPYELFAYDVEDRFCAPYTYMAQVAEIITTSSPALPAAFENTLSIGVQAQTQLTGLALRGVAMGQKHLQAVIDRVEKENKRLTSENDGLRAKLVAHWDTIEKLNTHELENREQAERTKRMGSIAETAITAMMARLTGKGSSPAQVIDMKLFQMLFKSLSTDPERLQKILAHLGDDERLAVMDLVSRANAEPETSPHPDAIQQPNGLAAASAAAATNGKGN